MTGWQARAMGQVVAMDTRFDSPGKQMLLVCYKSNVCVFWFVYLCAGHLVLVVHTTTIFRCMEKKFKMHFDTFIVFCF